MWPRGQGQQWALAKMHEQKHVPDDIERHGPPMSSFSGPTEHQHIAIKRDAERTSKNRSKLDKQLGDRLHETYVINTAFDNLQSQKDNAGQVAEVVIKPQNYIPSNCATALLRLTQEGNGMTQSSNSAHFVVSEDIVVFLQNLYHTHVFRDNATIVVHSEVVKDGVLYRAHPFYYTAKRPWYDFAMIRFGKDNLTDNFAVQECFAWHGDPDNIREDHHYAPGRILAFLHEQTNEVIKGQPINDM